MQTGSGDIRTRDLGKGLRAQTGSGNIRAESVAAPFTGQTGSGDIEADLTGSGDVDVHTGSGTIRVRGIKGGMQGEDRQRQYRSGRQRDRPVAAAHRLRKRSPGCRQRKRL